MALYQGLEQNTDAQRQALLNAIAQQGRLGAQAYQAQTSQQGADFRSALAANDAITQGTGPGVPGGVLAKINSDASAQRATYAGDASIANTAFQNFTSGVGQANDAYFRQASAAVPAMREQTQGIIAQIRAEQEAAALEREERRKQAEYDAMMRELDRQAAEDERAFQREQWDFEREMMERQLREDATASSGEAFEDETARYGEAVDRRRAEIRSVVNSEGAGSILPEVFEEIVGGADGSGATTSMADAMLMAQNLMGAQFEADIANGAPVDGSAYPYLLQHIYAYFNPTEPVPGLGALYNYMQENGLEDLMPYASQMPGRRANAASSARYAGQAEAWYRRSRGRRPSGGN